MNDVKINFCFDKLSWSSWQVKRIMRACVRQTLCCEGVMIPCEINVMITDNPGIQSINKAHRSIDKPTDVLSFPMFDLIAGSLPEDWSELIDPESGRCPLGDMAISLEKAVEQAREFGHSTRREIGYLTIHSMLHLLGYDHMDDGPQKAQMRKREEEIAALIPKMGRDE